MSFRLISAAALCCLAVAPAYAEPASPSAKMAEKMSDPATQQAMTAAVKALSEAMLDMPLAPFAKAAEAAGDKDTARKLEGGGTLREYAGPSAERMPEEMSRRLPAMMGAMGGMAVALEGMLPMLAGMAKDMKDAAAAAAPPVATD